MKRAYYLAGLAALVLVSLAVLAVQPALGQEEQQGQGQEEPTTGVARVSLVHGDVTSMRGDSGDWVAATVNAPLVRGDKITTGDSSQVEIQLDYANVLRLAPRTEATIADLTRSRIQIQVAQGVANFSVLKGSEAEAEIDTPNMAVRPLAEGAYRIVVNSPTETQLIVRQGQAEVSNPDGSTRVESGRMIRVQGSDHPEYQIASAPGIDEWDKWNKERDNQINDAQSYTHANRYYTGAQDLDRNGRWVDTPDYGSVWTPDVGADWAPYRDGSWTWEPYWGWTWVSYEPWGWAPYHYGRWFYYGNSWCWWPGYHAYGYRPMWGPAYVSFLGFGFGGRNWGFGFGYGYNSIGWCPLGPYDSYRPWWGRHNTYRAVNITNITNMNNYNSGSRRPLGPRGYTSNLQAALTNDRIRGGITQASTEDFTRGRVPRQQPRLDANALRQGQLVQGTLPAVPTRESLRPVSRPANAAAFSGRSGGAQTFFSRQQPPATTRSFAQQSAAIQQMVQRNPSFQGGGQVARPAGTSNLGRQPAASIQGATSQRATPGAGNQPAVNAGRAPNAANGRVAGTNSGWSSFGQPAASSPARTAAGQAPAAAARSPQAEPATRPAASQAAPASQQQPGWQRFGTGQPRAVPNRPTTTGTSQAARARVGEERSGGSRQAPASAAPRETGNPSRPTGVESKPAPRSAAEPSRFQSFGGQSQPSVASRPAPSSQQSSGWSRFGSASSSSERPALDIRKPIVTQRAAPRSYRGGGTSGGWGNRQQSAPTPPPRNLQGGRAAPSAPPSTYQGGGWGGGRSAAPQRSYGGGGNRGWSAPSGGGGGRSTQSAPSRSYGGGGGGGGGRGASAPSGGGHVSSGSSSGGGSRGHR